MCTSIAKSVEISQERAQRLEQLSALSGTPENTLVEQGLDLLFREIERHAIRERRSRRTCRSYSGLNTNSVLPRRLSAHRFASIVTRLFRSLGHR